MATRPAPCPACGLTVTVSVSRHPSDSRLLIVSAPEHAYAIKGAPEYVSEDAPLPKFGPAHEVVVCPAWRRAVPA